jgi:hypothetical protein
LCLVSIGNGNPSGWKPVKTATELAEALQNAIDQPENGVVGLADDLLRLCPDSGIRLDWCEGFCRIRFIGTNEAIDVPIRKSAIRALLARFAALCNDKSQRAVARLAALRNDKSQRAVSPYGGQGELTSAADHSRIIRASFVNTPGEQWLQLDVTAHSSAT